MFCSQPCCREAQRAIFDAFKAGLLDGILAEARARAKAQAAARFQTSSGPDYWYNGHGLETLREREIRELGAPL
jgi:hypothetical protein